MHPTPAQPTDDEQAEIERLHTRHDELVNMDEDAWTDELIEEADAIEPRLEQIQDAIKARAVFKPEDIAISGCIITVGNDGTLQVVHGLVKPEDMPATDTASGTSEASAHVDGGQHDGQQATSGIQSPAISGPAMPPARPDPEAEARKEAGVGIGLADDLRAIRTALVKAHLADDFGAAFDLMLFQMGRAVFTPGYHDHALDIAVRETRDRPPLRANDDAFGHWSPGEAMLADRSSLSFDWLEIEDRQESFAALRALPESDKQRLFAACVARTVNGQLAFEADARPELEATVARPRHRVRGASSGPPPRCSGRASARTGCCPSPARSSASSGRTRTARTRRPRWPAAMETAFAKGDSPPLGVTKEGHAAALAWVAARLPRLRHRPLSTTKTRRRPRRKPRLRTSRPRTRHLRTKLSPADTSPSRGSPVPPANGQAPEGQASSDTGDVEQSAPSDSTPDPATTGSPGVPDAEVVAPTGHEAIDAMNAVPVAGGGPRVIVSTVGLENGGDGDASPDADPPAPPVQGNGHGTVCDSGGDGLDIPAFLRRS